MEYNPMPNYGVADDSQLYYRPMNTLEQYQVPIQNISQQFENMNFGDQNSVQSLENNLSISEGPISSLPLYMRKIRPIRSQSINRTNEGSSYMKQNFLFDKITASHIKDDNSLQSDQNPISLENLDAKQFMPRILIYNKQDNDNLSSVGGSSQSSLVSFNDAGSLSSLDLSFDGSGMPYIRNQKQSAFSRVKSNKSDHSNDDQMDDNGTYEMKVDQNMNDVNESSHDSKTFNKSSFYRLKNDSSKRDDSHDRGGVT